MVPKVVVCGAEHLPTHEEMFKSENSRRHQMSFELMLAPDPLGMKERNECRFAFKLKVRLTAKARMSTMPSPGTTDSNAVLSTHLVPSFAYRHVQFYRSIPSFNATGVTSNNPFTKNAYTKA